MLGAAVRLPVAGAGPHEAAFGGDGQIFRVGRKRLADQALGDVGAVGVGGVYEGYADLHDAPEYGPGLFGVCGFAPDALAGDPHGAEAQAVYLQVAADGEGSGRRCVGVPFVSVIGLSFL